MPRTLTVEQFNYVYWNGERITGIEYISILGFDPKNSCITIRDNGLLCIEGGRRTPCFIGNSFWEEVPLVPSITQVSMTKRLEPHQFNIVQLSGNRIHGPEVLATFGYDPKHCKIEVCTKENELSITETGKSNIYAGPGMWEEISLPIST